ncbi:MAG TPA: CheR family methyltransferase [Treponemataceae bacterium]|nr:CheR family methyltransferase [Treponemataceae bacterium]
MTDQTFKRFKEFIEGTLGIKIPPAKKVMLESRFAKRVRTLGMESMEEYCDYVFSPEGYDLEIQQLMDAVTTNETSFFRESHHFDYLEKSVLPEYAAQGLKDINIWSVAASTGQEAYTLAMVMEEFMSRTGYRFNYRILGTDISETVLHIANTGIYTEHQASKIPPVLQRRYCRKNRDPEQKTIRIIPALRDRVVFGKMNLMNETYPLGKQYHIVFCRNVFIYFERETQKKVLNRIFRHIMPGGYLFMGHSENLSNTELPLTSVSSAVYRKEGAT